MIGKNGKAYYQIPVEIASKLLALAKSKPDNLTKFEADFLNDKLQAIQQFGPRAVATRAQIVKLEQILFDRDVYNELQNVDLFVCKQNSDVK